VSAAAQDTAPGEPTGRCYRCCKPALLCICARVEAIANRTRITILQHPRERLHPLGTARIASLALSNSELLIPRDVANRSLAVPPITAPGTGLLFPSVEATPLEGLDPAAMPSGLIVLDGTWSQARKLYQGNPWLESLPHYALTPSSPTRYRIRRAPRPNYISTVEAIVSALRLIEPETQRLNHPLAVFDTMIDDQIAYAQAHRRPRRPERKIARREAARSVQRTQHVDAPTDENVTEKTSCAPG
jgi:DTW domain-containing protein YfiP